MKNTYMIGSHAMRGFFIDFPRAPFDYDYLVYSDEYAMPKVQGERIENHVIPVLYSYLDEHGMSPDVLLTLKCSHIFWDIKWEKNMFDIVFLFEHGAKVIESLFYDLYYYWQSVHGENKRSDLTMSGESFFNNALKTYDHDVLHTFINPHPTYNKVLKDGAEVEVSREKFDSLTREEKLELVREEVYVMAFERLADRDYRVAYAWMLKKFIMNHAPLWECLFILANYRELHRPIINYKNIIEDGLSRDSKGFRKQ